MPQPAKTTTPPQVDAFDLAVPYQPLLTKKTFKEKTELKNKCQLG
jgi:hypothetical protein